MGHPVSKESKGSNPFPCIILLVKFKYTYNITPFGSMTTTKEKRPKTASIRERSIYVYLPGTEMVKQWKKMANQSGMSISKFVIEHVNNSLHQEQNKESHESILYVFRRTTTS